jgi:dihydroorotase
LLLPGAIDVHVHFRDLDEAYKEDWYSGSCAAAAGGVTTVIDQPNTKPPVCDESSYFRKQRAARKSVVDYGINAGIEKLDQLDDLWRLGVTALFKKNRARNYFMRCKLSSISMPCYAFTLKDVSVKSQVN